MVGEQGEPQRHGVDSVVPEPRNEDEVALGLRHLLAAEPDHACVDVRLRIGRATRRDLAFGGTELMMRKDQVGSAALDVEAHAEIAQCDRRTFNMPAWPSGTEGRWPGRIPLALRLPEQAVDRILLA